MRSTYFVPGIMFFLILPLLMGCGNDDSQQRLLQGKWSLEKAFRGENRTELLNQLFFEFSEDGGMTTNINNGQLEQGKYELSGDVIHQTESSMNLDFEIEALTDSTLVIQTSIRNMPFKFFFVRDSL